MKSIALLAAAFLAATTSVALPTREPQPPQATNPLRVKLSPTIAARKYTPEQPSTDSNSPLRVKLPPTIAARKYQPDQPSSDPNNPLRVELPPRSAPREPQTPQSPNSLRSKVPRTTAARVQHHPRKPTPLRPGSNLNAIKSTTFNATSTFASTTNAPSFISPNWSGAVATPPSSLANFTSVGGRIVVPSIRRPLTAASNSTDTYSAAAWVGIDGDTNSAALLQTGIAFSIDPSGAVTYDAWWEWYPYAAQFYDNFTMAAGDVIQMNATAQSSTSGLLVLENLSNGDRAEASVALPSNTRADLTGANVEWIVEDFEVGSELVPVVDWESVMFSETWWEDAEGGQGSAVGAEVWNLEGKGGEVVSDVVIEKDGRVVDYFVERL